MKISLNWLKEFVKIPDKISPEKIGIALTLKTVEVEGIERQGENLENVVIGKIKKIEKHPNADKLKVCFVDIGEKKNAQIVCGGTNLREDMITVVAKIGAEVRWHGEGELIKLKKVKLRGVESNGMICASSELGLLEIIPQNSDREIIDLTKSAIINESSVGAPIAKVLSLNDIVFDIDNKSLTHRPDLWGHYGIAREIVAIFLGIPLAPLTEGGINRTNFFSSPLFKGGQGDSKNGLQIKVDIKDKKLCPRYMAVAMSGIKIGQSPQWMQNRLLAVGMRPINNIVDITNYVMLELGQPMHGFDKLKVGADPRACPKIIVRNAKKGEKIRTLDGEDRELDSKMLVIADNKKPIAIAGVMGGSNSEIDDNTTEIILESANFEKVNNRKTSAKLGLRTEASMRYEKGLDFNLTEQALSRCVELIKKIIPSTTISSDIIDVGITTQSVKPIKISLEYIQKKIGVDIDEKKVVSILESLGFGVARMQLRRHSLKGLPACLPVGKAVLEGTMAPSEFKITVPSWRATGDVSIADDIIEEIARIYGYDDIKPVMPSVIMEAPLENDVRKFERSVKNILSIGFGMAESQNYSFVSDIQIENLGIDVNNHIKLMNPLSAEHSFLRSNLIINLLENVKKNLKYFDEFSMFEIGNVFKNEKGSFLMKNVQKDLLPLQEKNVTGIVVLGKKETPFYRIKEIVTGLLDELSIDFNITDNFIAKEWMHPYRKSEIKNCKSKSILGYITELNPVIAEKIGIKNARVGIFNFKLDILLKLSGNEKKYKKLSKYPSIIRDLSLVVDKKLLYSDISDLIKKDNKLVQSVQLFDVFEDVNRLGDDKKSIALHIIFSSDERTLTDQEVSAVLDEIVINLKKKLEAEIRE
ncbi:phenylalanine--tRNA ligase subunit beta [Patescibacteria group bacterium]